MDKRNTGSEGNARERGRGRPRSRRKRAFKSIFHAGPSQEPARRDDFAKAVRQDTRCTGFFRGCGRVPGPNGLGGRCPNTPARARQVGRGHGRRNSCRSAFGGGCGVSVCDHRNRHDGHLRRTGAKAKSEVRADAAGRPGHGNGPRLRVGQQQDGGAAGSRRCDSLGDEQSV